MLHDLDDRPGLVTDPAVLVLRIDGPLFFAWSGLGVRGLAGR